MPSAQPARWISTMAARMRDTSGLKVRLSPKTTLLAATTRAAVRPPSQRQLPDLRRGERPPPAEPGDLRATAEAVGHDERLCGRLSHAGQEHSLGARNRHVVMAALEAEVAGEAAAARVEHLGVEGH